MEPTRYEKKAIVPRRDYSTALMVISELVIVSLIAWIGISSGVFRSGRSEVLSTMDERVEATPTKSASPEVVITLSPTPVKLEKDTYTIAVIGDSMVDTMGEKLDYLDKALHEKFPETKFNLYNYGKGSINVEDGISLLGTDFNYKDRHYPLLYQTIPDVVIVGSFAYNPFTPYDRDRHWLGLTHLVQEAQKTAPEVYMLAEVAPLGEDFGRGPQGVNWDKATAAAHASKIREQLENAVGLAQTLNVPLIDVYHETTDEAKLKDLVDTADGIHPSVKGHEFMAQKIAEALQFK